MKHFIYMDTDILYSYLSQINDGLIKNIHKEVTDEVLSTSTNETIEANNKNEVSMGFKPIFNIKLSEDPDVMKTTNTLSQLESGKQLIETLIHDNAFQQFINYLDKNNLLIETSNCKKGDYVKFNDDYVIRDLDYVLSVYTDEFISFLCDESVNDQMGQAVKKAKMSQCKKQHEDTRRIIRIAKSVLPSSSFIISSDCFIPINQKFLRQPLKSIRFNYSGKINILGMYSSTLQDSVSVEKLHFTAFDDMFSSFDEINKIFYNDNIGIPLTHKILVPIALYFE